MSLTTTSRTFRKGLKIVGIFAVIYYLMILLVIPNVRDAILNAFVDRDPPKPKFGVLEGLKFQPITLKNTNPPQYVLDTKDGRLPAGLPKKMIVYPIKPARYSYLAGKNAQRDAEILGFAENELISDLKGREYQWQSLTSGGFLSINTETRSILVVTDLYGKSAEYRPGTIDYESAKEYMTTLLKSLGRFYEPLYSQDNYKVYLGILAGSSLVETKVVAQAQIARVDVFGKVKDYMIFGPDGRKGQIVAIIRAPKDQNKAYNYPVIEGYFWDVDLTSDATYPIITVSEAWKQVQAGKGVLASAFPKNGNPFENPPKVGAEKILVNKIYLGYYMTPEYQRYLHPIYVFEGSYVTSGTNGGSILIYYPALTAQYSKAPAEQPAKPTTQN